MRDRSGYFAHSVAANEKELAKEPLCSQCGRQSDCAMNLKRKQGVSRDAPQVIAVMACEEFMPRIVMHNTTIPTGLFNTLRLGDKRAIYNGVKQMQVIDKDGEHVCYVNIDSIKVGPKDSVLDKHGHKNHTVKELDLKRDEKTEQIKRTLPRKYHSHLWARTELLSAIYMRKRNILR